VNVAVRNGLNVVRVVGGAVAFAALAWMAIGPEIHKPMDFREILFAVFGLPAGGASLLLKMDKDSEI
jgi:hypothetical protein